MDWHDLLEANAALDMVQEAQKKPARGRRKG